MAKPNMNPQRNPMPTQDPAARAHNFDEVALGYTEENADKELAQIVAEGRHNSVEVTRLFGGME